MKLRAKRRRPAAPQEAARIAGRAETPVLLGTSGQLRQRAVTARLESARAAAGKRPHLAQALKEIAERYEDAARLADGL